MSKFQGRREIKAALVFSRMRRSFDPQRSEVEMFGENYSDDFVGVGGIGGRAGKEEWE